MIDDLKKVKFGLRTQRSKLSSLLVEIEKEIACLESVILEISNIIIDLETRRPEK